MAALPGAMLTAVLLACGDEGSPAGGDPGTEPGITGVVARQKTGVGVPGVTLTVLAAGQPVTSAVSGPDGSFDTGRLQDGSYVVVPVGLELAGLDPRFDVMEPMRDTVQVESGKAPALVFAVVGIVPARITGEVTCGGSPDPGASIRVAGGGSTDRTVVADALGRYGALDLLPGVYTVLPAAASCALSPAYVVLDLRPGEFGRVDFSGS